ncbi:MAG: hypothetical protein HOV79_04945, partial [Hamadaea sp.]|nr:hypothetical protein [Hamadaea sp.]
MTAHRNGRFRRAALRLVTVAGFAAAAWFIAHGAAQAAERPETPIDPAGVTTQENLRVPTREAAPVAQHSAPVVRGHGGSAHRGPAQGSGGPMTVPVRTLTGAEQPLLRTLLGGEAESGERAGVPGDGAGARFREDRVDAPDLITSLLQVPPGLTRRIGVQQMVMGVDAVLSSPAATLTNEADALLTAVLTAADRPADDLAAPAAPSTGDVSGTANEDRPAPRPGPPPRDPAPLLRPLLKPIAQLTADCDRALAPVLAITARVARPLLAPVVDATEPLVTAVTRVLGPLSLLVDTVSTHLIQPVVHALTGAAAPALAAVPIGVLPDAPSAAAEAVSRDQAR